MRASVQRTASARLLAMPAVMRVSSVATSSRLSLAITGVSSGPSGPGPQGPGPPRELLDSRPRDPARAGRLAAGHELEEYRGRQLVQFAPEVVEGLAVLTVERLEGPQALRPVGRRVDDQPRDQLAGLDLGIVAVLEHLDPLDRRVGEALVHVVDELVANALELGLFHDRLP